MKMKNVLFFASIVLFATGEVAVYGSKSQLHSLATQASSFDKLKQVLTQHPGSINDQDEGGNTAAHIAAFYFNPNNNDTSQMLAYLIRQGANTDIKNTEGYKATDVLKNAKGELVNLKKQPDSPFGRLFASTITSSVGDVLWPRVMTKLRDMA